MAGGFVNSYNSVTSSSPLEGTTAVNRGVIQNLLSGTLGACCADSFALSGRAGTIGQLVRKSGGIVVGRSGL